MSDHESSRSRIDDMPGPLRWALVAIKEVGILAALVFFLLYFVLIKQNEYQGIMNRAVNSLDANTAAVNEVKNAIIQQNRHSERVFRKILGNKYDDD